ncbi:MAG: Rieske 2Fe-2S domain-containing protein [Gammaproteobacteria bacterium]
MIDPVYISLCAFDELQDPGSKGITIMCDARPFDLFVVRQGGEVRAYLNSCPHTGGPLDWVEDQFLSIDRRYIQCATHDALFRWEDGTCVAGPCAGDALTALPAVIEEGEVLLPREVLCDGSRAGLRA